MSIFMTLKNEDMVTAVRIVIDILAVCFILFGIRNLTALITYVHPGLAILSVCMGVMLIVIRVLLRHQK